MKYWYYEYDVLLYGPYYLLKFYFCLHHGMDRDLHFVWGGGSGKLVPDYGRLRFKAKIHHKIEIVCFVNTVRKQLLIEGPIFRVSGQAYIKYATFTNL